MECTATISRRGSYCVFCGTIRSKSERPGDPERNTIGCLCCSSSTNKESIDAARFSTNRSCLKREI